MNGWVSCFESSRYFLSVRFVALACSLFSFQAVLAIDFDDLKENQGKVYGSEKEKRFVIDAFFVEWESFPRNSPHYSSLHFFWLYNTTNYPKYERSVFFPFFSLESSKVDKRFEANHLLLSHYSREADGSYTYHLFPFYWTGAQTNGFSYHSILPFYYSDAQVGGNKKEKTIVFPGYYQNISESLDKKSEQLTSFSPFHVYTTSNSSQNEVSQFWFPALPIYYSFSDFRSKHKNYFWFIDTEFDLEGDSYSQVWIAPFVFWKKDSYLNIVPFYISTVLANEKQGEYFGFIPPYYYCYSENSKTFYMFNYFSSTAYGKDSSENFTTLSPFFFGSSNSRGYSQIIVPGIFYSETEEDSSTHKNILLAYDHSFDKKGVLDSLIIAPFYFFKKDTYFHIAPFYFSTSSNDDRYGGWFGILPPVYYHYTPTEKVLYVLNYYSSSNITKDSYENFTIFAPIYFYEKGSFLHIAPIYWSWIDKGRYNAASNVGESYHTLAVPFFYREKNADNSSYTNLLGLASREYDNKGKLNGSMAFPFYFYKRDSYDIFFPFSFKFGPDEEAKDTGTRFGFLYYNDWNPKDETLWIANWYSDEDKENKTYFKSLNPIYYSWKNKDSSGDVSPLYLNLHFPNQDSFHLNLSGYSSNVASGIIKPDINFGMGKKDGYQYLDTDISWLWYAFRISTRTSIKIFDDVPRNADLLAKKEVGSNFSPRLSKRKTFSREDSVAFLGVDILFGLYGWEAGDSKRHVRAFPLAWLTWDTKSDDKIYTVPPLFINYYSQDLQYTVLFPFYGYQKTTESERTALAIVGYLRESLLEDHSEEKTILWPLANWHSSDIKSGSRILPFYWYQNRSERQEELATLLTPIFLYNNTLDKNGIKDSSVISPLWFRFYTREADKSWDANFALPFYFFQEARIKQQIQNLFVSLPYIYYEASDIQSKVVYNKTLWIFPSYYSKEFAKTDLDITAVKFYSPVFAYHSYKSKSNAQNENYWFAPVPLLYHSYSTKNDESYWNWLAFASYEKSKTSNNLKVYPIFYQDFYEQDAMNFNDSNWILPLYYWNHKKTTSLASGKKGEEYISESEVSFYSLFWNYTNINDSNRKWFIPLALTYHSESPKESYYNILLFLSREKSENKSALNIFPLYSQSFEYGHKENVVSSMHFLFPFFYINDENKLEKERLESKLTFVTPVGYYKLENNMNEEWFFTGLYHSESPIRSYTNFLFFFSNENSKQKTALNLFPIFGKSESLKKNGKPIESNYWSGILPFWLAKKYATAKNAGETTLASLPIYLNYRYDTEESEASYLNLWINPLVFNYTRVKDETSWSWLLFSKYSGNAYRTSMLLLPISGFDFDRRNTGRDYSSLWVLPAFYFEKEDNRQSGRFDKTFISLLYNEFETERKSEKTFETSILFPILPFLFYKNTTQNTEHTTLLTFLDYEYQKEKLTRLTVFPYWYSINSDNPNNLVQYRHVFPFYFSKGDANENSKLISGLYLSSDHKSITQNLLMLAEHKYTNESAKTEIDFLFRSIHFAKAIREVNVRLLYGLGNYFSGVEETSMNLLWISSKNSKDYTQNSVLPFFYQEEDKKEDQMWIAPALYYSKTSPSSKVQHAALGAFYYQNSDTIKREEHLNLLMGILYYKTSIAKERGYEGQGSLWGLLWEYKTESETKYSKFAVLKFVYSKTTDEKGDSYQRILGVRI